MVSDPIRRGCAVGYQRASSLAKLRAEIKRLGEEKIERKGDVKLSGFGRLVFGVPMGNPQLSLNKLCSSRPHWAHLSGDAAPQLHPPDGTQHAQSLLDELKLQGQPVVVCVQRST
ncbi:hypothetical protein WN55_08312 [Dufourea novaeangliae]|uniref:Uncharacterized protein n=1 Tax=Dufourea novaeangliae TaxID=178035 RepID=A0A154P6R9_DUFNO|nr:hypothetical protein WN55_08312 [Dufourea novaeangliae]